MKKIIFRILAFSLDLFLSSMIILGLSMINYINPNSNEVNNTTNEYYEIVNKRQTLEKELDKYFEDKILDQNEKTDIYIRFNPYKEAFNDIKIGEKIKNKDIDKVKEKIQEIHLSISNEYGIKINKLNLYEILISVTVYILYFGVLQYLLKGQTPMKRLFRLKVVNNNKKNKIPLWSFIIRGILVTEVILSITDLVMLFTLKDSIYITSSYWVTQFKYIYEMAFLLCMILRDDMRSIHDIILNTKVIRYDKNGKIIDEYLFNEYE